MFVQRRFHNERFNCRSKLLYRISCSRRCSAYWIWGFHLWWKMVFNHSLNRSFVPKVFNSIINLMLWSIVPDLIGQSTVLKRIPDRNGHSSINWNSLQKRLYWNRRLTIWESNRKWFENIFTTAIWYCKIRCWYHRKGITTQLEYRVLSHSRIRWEQLPITANYWTSRWENIHGSYPFHGVQSIHTSQRYHAILPKRSSNQNDESAEFYCRTCWIHPLDFA